MVGAVVDPGGEVPRIRKAIDETGLKVEKIILTHGHIDHAGGAAELRDNLGVPVEGPHRADEFLLKGLAEQGHAYGFPARAVAPEKWLDERDRVEIGSHAFQVFHCPGHSPGSVVLFNAPHRFAIVGDVLFRGSIGRTDFPYGQYDRLIEGIRTKLLPLGDDVVFICGHGPSSSFGAERKTNPFLR
jgi:glyoxylase-like metal-dependent hydrolase (beta-lactamase superfamily II)